MISFSSVSIARRESAVNGSVEACTTTFEQAREILTFWGGDLDDFMGGLARVRHVTPRWAKRTSLLCGSSNVLVTAIIGTS